MDAAPANDNPKDSRQFEFFGADFGTGQYSAIAELDRDGKLVSVIETTEIVDLQSFIEKLHARD